MLNRTEKRWIDHSKGNKATRPVLEKPVRSVRVRTRTRSTVSVYPDIPMEKVDVGRTRILLPGGIGDVYWSLVKFQAFCKRKDITDPYVAFITTKPAEQYAGSEFRALDFLRMVPFVRIDEPYSVDARPTPTPPWLNNLYREMWHGTRTSCPGFMGYDDFLVYNSAITNGRLLEEVDDLECDWYFPLVVSMEQEDFRASCQRKYGKYAVYLWSFCGGGYSEYHVEEFSIAAIAESIRRFTELSKLTPVFVGSWWDVNHGNTYLRDIIAATPNSVNLVGKTTVDQLFGVIRGSELVVGCHCGPTILATVFHKKTIILWAKSYPMFAHTSRLAVSPPDTRFTNYWPVYTSGLTVNRFVGKMQELYRS